MFKYLELGNRLPFPKESAFTTAYNKKWRLEATEDGINFTVFKIPDSWVGYKPCDCIYSDNEWDYRVEAKSINKNNLPFSKIRPNQYWAMGKRIKLWRKCFLVVYSKEINDYKIFAWQDFLDIKANREAIWKKSFDVF